MLRNDDKYLSNCNTEIYNFANYLSIETVLLTPYFVAGVGLNLVRTVGKALEGQVVVSIMERDLHEYLFPSITICSKYKDGNSDVLPILWLQSWNDSGYYFYSSSSDRLYIF